MAVTSRTQLQDYALRRLGAPVINIEVDQQQVDDRIDDALQFFQEYHSESVEKVWLKHVVTANHIRIVGTNAQSFTKNETITGSISGATCTVWDTPEDNKIRSKKFVNGSGGTFVEGETITGSSSGATAVIMTGGLFIGDIQNQYITVSDLVTHITSVLPLQNGSNQNDIFSMQYQIRMNELYNISSTTMLYYTQVQQHLSLIEHTLVTRPRFDFKRKANTITINVDWATAISPDMYIIFECFRILDPSTVSKVYDDIFLKRYVTALIQRQWGMNISKYLEITLPGGIKMNGDKILSDAEAEIEKLEAEVQSKWGMPPMGIVG